MISVKQHHAAVGENLPGPVYIQVWIVSDPNNRSKYFFVLGKSSAREWEKKGYKVASTDLWDYVI